MGVVSAMNEGKFYATDLKVRRIRAGMKSTDVAKFFSRPNSWVTRVEHGDVRITKEQYDEFIKLYGDDEEIEFAGSGIARENAKLKKMIKILEIENTSLKHTIEELKHILELDYLRV